jgi:hypothetical protein
MLSKLKKLLKFAPQFFTIFGAMSIAIALLLSVVNVPVAGQAETCPVGNGWIKENVGDEPSFQYTAPDGMVVAESCYKAGSNPLVYDTYDPPQKQVSLTSKYQQGISHASFRLVAAPTNTPVTPTNTPVTPTNTPVTPTNTPVTPTNTPITPTNTPVTPTNTPVTPTNTPTNTAIPDDPDPSPTPTNTEEPKDPDPTPTNTDVPVDPTPTTTEDPNDPDPTNTPVPDETPDPTNTPVPDETPDPTEPPVTDETPEPTLAPPDPDEPPTVLIPVTGVELPGNSPLSDVQNIVFNMGLSFLGIGLVLQSIRKRFNF